MDIDRIDNPFTYEDEIFIKMSPDELRELRFDLSIARVSSPHVRWDAIDAFMDRSGEVV